MPNPLQKGGGGSILLAAATALLAAPCARAQMGADTVGSDEFPGLQLLPVGSVVKGISLPRYDGHRVSSLFRAEKMEVLSRSQLRLDKLRAELYAATGETTSIHSAHAIYSFSSKQADTDAATTVSDPRFTAHGTGARFSTSTHCGLLYGPVRTTVPTRLFAAGDKSLQKP